MNPTSIADIRRKVLRSLIQTRFHGVARQLAIAAGKPDGQINDMLSDPPRKPFGERVARDLETRLELQTGYFDSLQYDQIQVEARHSGEPTSHPPSQPSKKPKLAVDNRRSASETELLDGFRVADPITQEHMLDMARKALRVFKERSRSQ